jgi:hypothetical protein
MHDLDLTDINVMNSPYFYLQPNDYIYIKPLKKTWERKDGYRIFRDRYHIVVIGNNDLLPVI